MVETLSLRRLPLPVLVVCLLLWPIARTAAQRASTSLEGTATDASGSVVAQATVRLTSVETGYARTAATNEAGTYAFPDLTPGKYSITAEAKGFKTTVIENLTLYVGPPVVQDIKFELGTVSEQVSVTATSPLLRQSTAEIGTVISDKALTELPLNGRNFLQLNQLTPGVIRSKNGGTFDDVQINPTAQGFDTNGSRMDYNVYLLDGVNIKEYQHGSNMYSPSVDAIQEFNQGTSNYGAAFGSESGAQVSVVTKAGTNQYHGDLYDFMRNNNLDARNFFELAHHPGPYHRNQFGGTFGGPVEIPKLYNGKDKTFFFLSYEGFRDSRQTPELGYFPTAQQLGGNLSDLVAPGGKPVVDPVSGVPYPNNTIPASQIPSTLTTFLQSGIGKGPWLPLPNTSGPGYNYFRDSAYRFDNDQVIARVDQKLGNNTFLYGT